MPEDAVAPGRRSCRQVLARAFDWRRWTTFAKSRTRQGLRRVKGSAIPVLEAAIASGLAWFIAGDLMGRPYPFMAPIACCVSLGFHPDREPRKVAEIGAGATIGVVIGELGSHAIGMGPVQMAVVILVAALVGRFLDSGDLFSMQVTTNAIVILALSSGVGAMSTPDAARDRWIDALVGAALGFVVAIFIPRRPMARSHRMATSFDRELAILLGLLADGLRSGDVAALRALRGQREALDLVVKDFGTAVDHARNVTKFNPAMRKHRAQADELHREYRLSKRALRTVDMLSRQALGMTEEIGPGTSEIADYVTRISLAVKDLGNSTDRWQPPDAARAKLLGIASDLAPSEVETDDWRPVALMSVLRALVVDLLQLTGLSKKDARRALAENRGLPFAETDSHGVPPIDSPEDRGSRMW